MPRPTTEKLCTAPPRFAQVLRICTASGRIFAQMAIPHKNSGKADIRYPPKPYTRKQLDRRDQRPEEGAGGPLTGSPHRGAPVVLVEITRIHMDTMDPPAGKHRACRAGASRLVRHALATRRLSVLAAFGAQALDQPHDAQQDEHPTDHVIKSVESGQRYWGTASGPAPTGRIEDCLEDDEEPGEDHQARPPGTWRSHTAHLSATGGVATAQFCTVPRSRTTVPAGWCTSSIMAGRGVGNGEIEGAHVADWSGSRRWLAASQILVQPPDYLCRHAWRATFVQSSPTYSPCLGGP